MSPTHSRSAALQSTLKSFRPLAALALALLTLSSPAQADAKKPAAAAEEAPPPPPAIELGAPFADHAILQQGMAVPVWGWSKPGTVVDVEFAGQKKSATADKEGKWMVKLDALKASAEGREMTINEQGGKTRKLVDVLVGEVWFASGQSNMQWTAGKCSVAQIASALDPKTPIREFAINNFYSCPHPIEHAAGEWKVNNFSDYSAIALAFADKLHKELGVPIGILNCSFSQTSIESWTPRHGFTADSPHEYSRSIHAKLLQTDPSTPEHKQAWEKYFTDIRTVLQQNDERAKQGDTDFEPLPTEKRPGNMGDNRDASWMYNARLNPVVPYAVSGGIWNQGYANINGGILYYPNLHSLIGGWRKSWGREDLPVYFHQFYSPGNRAVDKGSPPTLEPVAEMRLGAWMARDIPHTGMASQIDMDGAIHYSTKTVPGQRLALHALKNQYGKKVVTDGPMYKGYEVKGDKLIISFDHAEGGLVVAETSSNRDKKKNPEATGFEDPKIAENAADKVELFYLAGEDKVWHPAKVEIQGDKAVISSPAVKAPRGVSYGTSGIGGQLNLYNKALLPMTPFIVYDQKMVTSLEWKEPLKIAGSEGDGKPVGLRDEYRKMPLLSTQFCDHAVLQSGVPITFWGSARHDWGYAAKGKAEVRFSFNGVEKTLEITPEMRQWQITVPAMKASAEPKTLEVRFFVNGELAHERVYKDLVVGDVWYVAGLGDQPQAETCDSPIRVMTRRSKGTTHHAPRPYSVCTSTSSDNNRFASLWLNPAGGFAAELGKTIHAKTGQPVGIIYMEGGDLELKQWMDMNALSKAPSLKADFENLSQLTPGTQFYRDNAERFIGEWKQYWGSYVPEMIATKRVPDAAPWGKYPQFAGEVTSEACQAYNVMLASFNRTAVKGVVFMTEPKMFEADGGKNFGSEMAALANSWKQILGKSDASQFIYTMPSKTLVAAVTAPTGIQGPSAAVELAAWPNKDKKGNPEAASVATQHQSIIKTVMSAAYP